MEIKTVKLITKDVVNYTEVGNHFICREPDFTLMRHLVQTVNITNRINKDGVFAFPQDKQWINLGFSPIQFMGKGTYNKIKKLNLPGLAYVNNTPTLFMFKDDALHVISDMEARIRALYELLNFAGKELVGK